MPHPTIRALPVSRPLPRRSAWRRVRACARRAVLLPGLATLAAGHAHAQATAPTPAPSDTTRVVFDPFTLDTRAHGAIAAEVGTIHVPRRHAAAQHGTIALRFVRLRATGTPTAPPVIYLAGGPGGSGIDAALGVRWPLFDAVRAHADVILLDQRGTGRSEPPPPCPRAATPPWPADVVLTADDAVRALQQEAARCVAAWRAAGVDLDAFTTAESVQDIDAVRRALGVDRVSLWGMSYGTHLALATLRAHPTRIARVVLMGTEGPDHTLKAPLEADRLLDRLHAWAARDRAAGVHTRDLRGDLAHALDRLRDAPVEVALPGAPAGAPPLRLGAFDLQLTVAGLLGRTSTSALLPVMLGALRRGDATLFAQLAWQVRQQVSRFAAMSLVMDVASGASPARRAQVAAEEERSVLGRALNFPWPDVGVGLGLPDLGEAFRAPLRTETPALFVSGTFDGRTPVANATEVMRGFRNARHLILEQAGHDDELWTASATVTERVAQFLAGRPVRGGTLRTRMLRVPAAPPPMR